MKRFSLLLGVVVFLVVSTVWALVPSEVEGAVPKLINFQGILRDGGGNPVPNGMYFVAFKIYDAPAGVTVLWTEVPSIAPNGGFFNVLLGATNPIPDSVFNGANRYLGITVESDPEMSPRYQLVSIGYAYRVNSVDGALGGTINGNINVTGKATIGSGHTNTGSGAFVAGFSNSAGGGTSAIGGGTFNTANGTLATIGGGNGNNATDSVATISGGSSNTASGAFATVGGGHTNTANGLYATVGGGLSNTAQGFASKVGGGGTNKATGSYSFVGGGISNLASGSQAVILGGQTDTASAPFASVGGGCGNSAKGSFAKAGGGFNNLASGFYSTVAGGDEDTATGDWSAIPGGKLNKAAGDYSFAAGRKAKALHHGSFVWADSTDADFSSTAANQFLIRASGGVGIGTANPQGALDMSSAAGAFIVPRMTTAQRNALTPVNGMIVYNTTDNQFNFYEAGAWVTK